MPVCEATSDEAIRLLREKEMAIVAARVDGSAAYTEIDFRRPDGRCPGQRSPRTFVRLDRSGHHPRPLAHARKSRQPERIRHRRRTLLRSPAPTHWAWWRCLRGYPKTPLSILGEGPGVRAWRECEK